LPSEAAGRVAVQWVMDSTLLPSGWLTHQSDHESEALASVRPLLSTAARATALVDDSNDVSPATPTSALQRTSTPTWIPQTSRLPWRRSTRSSFD